MLEVTEDTNNYIIDQETKTIEIDLLNGIITFIILSPVFFTIIYLEIRNKKGKNIKLIIIYIAIYIVAIISIILYKQNYKISNISSSTTRGGIKYEIQREIPKNIQIEQKEELGYKIIDDGNSCYINICAGMCSSGGYSLIVTKIEGDKNNLYIDVKLQGPPPGSTVTMSYTYPSVLIKLSERPNNFIVNKIR